MGEVKIIRRIWIVATTIISIIIIFNLKSCKTNRLEEENNILKSLLEDTLKKVRNKDSSQTATIGLLQGSSTKFILSIQTKDQTIKDLQDEIRKNKGKIKSGGSVTVIDNSTTIRDSSKSTVISSSNGCDSVIVSSNKDTTWINWKVRATRLQTNLDLIVKNKYSVVIGSERIGLFKRKPIVEVTNYNPYTDTKSLRAFEVKDMNRTRISLGVQIGYGITFNGLSPYVGIGLGYRIF